MRLAFNTVALAGLPVEEAVQSVLAAGYDEVELNAEELPWARPHVGPQTPASQRTALRDMAPYSSLCAHREGLSDPSAAVRQDAVAWTQDCITLAADLGIEVVHVIPGSGDDVEGLHTALSAIVESADTVAVVVALEGIVGQAISTSGAVLEAIRRVAGLRVNFDPSHFQVTEGDAVAAAERLAPYTVHAHLKDATGREGDFAFPPLGAGAVDFDGVLHALRGVGYNGSLSIEHEAHLFGDRRSPERVLIESKAFADALLDRVG